MGIVLISFAKVESKLFTSITSKSFEEGANPIQYNYGVAVSDVDNDGDFEFIVAGHGTGGAVADMDGDGQVELILSHGESASEPLTLYNVTKGETNNYIRILVKHKTNAPARGSSVRLFLED